MNQALKDAANKAATSWVGTHEYHQTAMIIQMLLDENRQVGRSAIPVCRSRRMKYRFGTE